jgi:glutamate carboxypeptidase
MNDPHAPETRLGSLHPLAPRILAHVRDRDEALRRDLAEWVAMPTGHGHGPGLDRQREAIVSRLERLGGTVRSIPGDPRPEWLLPAAGGEGDVPATTVVSRETEGPRVLLGGHIDTVHDPDGSFRELVPLEGHHATGPGAADMKGGLLVALAALETLEALGVPVSWSFFLNEDEETGSFHSFAALDAIAREHDVGLVFEPALAGGALAIERMGAGQFRVEAFGRAAHVGREFARGRSAVTALARCLVAVADLPDAEQGRIVNVGPIEGGKATNIVPDHAVAWGNVRFRDAATATWLGERIAALATSTEAMPRVEVEYLANRPAKPETPAVGRLADEAVAVAEAIGASLPRARTGGVCDGNILQAAGLPTLDNLGVRGGNLHRLDEFVELDSLVERTALTAILLARLHAGRIDLA